MRYKISESLYKRPTIDDMSTSMILEDVQSNLAKALADRKRDESQEVL